jgi:hypothetical protein
LPPELFFAPELAGALDFVFATEPVFAPELFTAVEPCAAGAELLLATCAPDVLPLLAGAGAPDVAALLLGVPALELLAGVAV